MQTESGHSLKETSSGLTPGSKSGQREVATCSHLAQVALAGVDVVYVRGVSMTQLILSGRSNDGDLGGLHSSLLRAPRS